VRVSDETGRLKHPGNCADRLSPHAKHYGQSFLAEMKTLSVHVVVRHQQPSSTPGVDVVARVARRQADELTVERLRVSRDDIPKSAQLGYFAPEIGGANHFRALVRQRALRDALGRRDGRVAEERLDSDQAFIADCRRFDYRAVGEHGRHRDDAGIQEIDMLDRLALFLQWLMWMQLNRAQIPLEHREVVLGQPREQLVGGA